MVDVFLLANFLKKMPGTNTATNFAKSSVMKIIVFITLTPAR